MVQPPSVEDADQNHRNAYSLFASREQEPHKVEGGVVEVGRVVRLELRVLSGVRVEHCQPSLSVFQHQQSGGELTPIFNPIPPKIR